MRKVGRKKTITIIICGGIIVCITVILTALLLAGGEDKPAEENLTDVLKKALSGTMVRIYAGEVSGSGIIYKVDKEEMVIVTAGHVLEQTEGDVWVSFLDDWAVACSEYRIAADADAAFICLPLTGIPQENLARYFTVDIDKESFDRLKSGDEVVVMGSKSGVAGNTYEGCVIEPWIYLEDFSQYMMTVKGEAVQGMSGGGVFDRDGHFVGILCGGSKDGELAVLPLSIINAKYRELF